MLIHCDQTPYRSCTFAGILYFFRCPFLERGPKPMFFCCFWCFFVCYYQRVNKYVFCLLAKVLLSLPEALFRSITRYRDFDELRNPHGSFPFVSLNKMGFGRILAISPMNNRVWSNYRSFSYENKGFGATFTVLLPQALDPNLGRRTNGKVPCIY